MVLSIMIQLLTIMRRKLTKTYPENSDIIDIWGGGSKNYIYHIGGGEGEGVRGVKSRIFKMTSLVYGPYSHTICFCTSEKFKRRAAITYLFELLLVFSIYQL